MRGVLALIAIFLAFGAMVWSAVPPSTSPARTVWTNTEDAMSDIAAWFRSGPADGQPDWEEAARAVVFADVDNGADLMVLHGCGACHAIPGIAGADGSVGPSLRGFADRSYVAGILPNEPGSLTRWLIDPPAHAPATAMPNLGLSEGEARDMAAYLMTLRGS
jgi:cytochrome c2